MVNDIGFKKLVYLLGLSSSSLIRNIESLFMFESISLYLIWVNFSYRSDVIFCQKDPSIEKVICCDISGCGGNFSDREFSL